MEVGARKADEFRMSDPTLTSAPVVAKTKEEWGELPWSPTDPGLDGPESIAWHSTGPLSQGRETSTEMPTKGEKIRRLSYFLKESFKPSDFGMFLKYGGFEEVLDGVQLNAETVRYFFDVVEALDHRGMVDAEFFGRLTEERPRKEALIRSLKEFWLDADRISSEPAVKATSNIPRDQLPVNPAATQHRSPPTDNEPIRMVGEMQVRLDPERVDVENAQAEPRKTIGLLGRENTGLQVVTSVRFQPIPTTIYHLLDPETDPLLTVAVKNESSEPRRICIKAYIEGLSDRAVKTIELGRMDRVAKMINLLPSLIPQQVRRITRTQRCTLHVRVVDLHNKVESHDTHTLVLLGRNASFNSVRDPETGRLRDLTKYYAAWVTPHVEPVQALVRCAADKVPGRRLGGYQGKPDPEVTATEVKALFDTLKEVGIAYVDSVIDFGAGSGQVTQRTRLPRESLRQRSATCIDGAVLFASLLECASFHAAIVLVPGHAFVGWETWQGSDEWDYLETTMIGSHDFEDARQRARTLYERFAEEDMAGEDGPFPRVLKLGDLRAQGIWPME
jgi:hypothetical protein